MILVVLTWPNSFGSVWIDEILNEEILFSILSNILFSQIFTNIRPLEDDGLTTALLLGHFDNSNCSFVESAENMTYIKNQVDRASIALWSDRVTTNGLM